MNNILFMLSLNIIGEHVKGRRRAMSLTQQQLAAKVGISRPTLNALENGRSPELGFTKVAKLLAAVGSGLQLQPSAARRLTLEELLHNDQSLDRQR